MSAFPIPLLASCAANLKHISISTIPTLRLASPSELPAGHGRLDALHLKSLTLSTSTPDLERFADWIPASRVKLNQLERLVIRTLGDKHKDGRTVINSPSLMTLYDTIDLGCLAALQRLTVRCWLSNISDSNNQPPLLTRLLRTTQGAGMLEELVLMTL
ncbi:hypothetical protein FA13DRAFT_1792889 [Coprinellus micaceus]|uniref:Uncharacterized protein n=1 Tax=Coprinellus micaceus TaxID=71717 RepID=A0A4Y7T8U9_COPMI|nr:hypothetical protein FA13DRAFT_1792889 [Coprinellus micaceus]